MNEHRWIQKLIQFQAQCRAYLMRKDLSSVRIQFEDIVREVDGGLDHLQWRGNIIPTPHFTDTESLLLQYGRSRNRSQHHVHDSKTEQMIENVDNEKSIPSSEVLVPDDTSRPLEKNREENVVGQNLTDDSTTLCGVMDADVAHENIFQKGSRLEFDTAHSPESLRQQRNALAMELLWIQQAISSRKKYLSLKQRMDVSH